MNLKPNQSPPIVPHVLVVSDRLHPYKLPKVERVEVLYSTATQVKLSGGKSKAARLVYCIPDDGAWIEFLEWYELLQTALDRLADFLRSLGHYPYKLKAAGGINEAPNPLTAQVIWAPCPDYNHSAAGLSNWEVYPNKRIKDEVVKHTPQMLKLLGNRLQEYATQADHFCCPDSIAWHKFGNLHNTAVFQSKCLLKFLDKLGTYEKALADEQYKLVAVEDYGNKPLNPGVPPEPIPTIYDFAPGDRVTFRLPWDGEYRQVIGHVSEENCYTKNAVIVTFMAPDNSRLFSQTTGIIALTKLPALSKVVSNAVLGLVPPEPAYSFGTSEFPSLPPESATEQISSEINSLKSQGTVAPSGVWIECCKVTHSTFRQAYWRSRDPCFTPKRGINPEAKCRKQYIGKEGSDAHKTAIATIERRNKIQKLTKQLPKTHHEH